MNINMLELGTPFSWLHNVWHPL